MRFGVLGPMEVWTEDGTPVPVTDLKVRVLLAHLLARPGRIVPADRLIDGLWGDALPANPKATLQARVSQLRRTLEDAEAGGRALVESRPAGYRLRIAAEAVDAGRFEALAARARRTAAPEARAALLGDALALWRGEAFAEFGFAEFGSAVTEGARLGELRLAALEERAEARLEAGEHALLAAELGGAVAAHPLRERLRDVHMRALYRAGRTSEALQSYDDLRLRLRDEMGLDPGPRLVELQQAILRQDPALDVSGEERPRTNLPVFVTDLVGRASALDELTGLLGSSRLVTLNGPGGVGKTRLAVETARNVVDHHPDGVWLVELAALSVTATAADVADLVAAVLGLRDDAASTGDGADSGKGGLSGKGAPRGEGAASAGRLGGVLRGKRMLLVLDNCEHVVEPVARLVAALLRDVPGLSALVTSQEPLGISGERLWSVPPLDSPERDAGTAPEELLRYGAVELFVQRVADAVHGFELHPDNAEAVAAVCRRLDGIPLALELAATRVRAMGVHTLAERLDDRFRLLATGKRDAPARQRTLRAMIDWSWEPLSETERTVLRRLAVHADGCTLEAAEEVCADEGVDVLATLAGLVDRSLVVVAEGPRYRLLESVAAYCVERLQEAGEYEAVRRRHHRYYAAFAERADGLLRGREQRHWLARMRAESANLHGALEGAVQDGHADLALRLANAMAWCWFLWGRHGEARRFVALALSASGEESGISNRRLLVRARTWRVGLTMLEGDGAERDARSRAALAAYTDDPRGLAWAEWFLGFVRAGFGDQRAIGVLLERSLAGFTALGDRWGMAAALTGRATLALTAGDMAVVDRDGRRGLALFAEIGDGWGRAQVTETLGVLAEVAGDYRRAEELHRDGLRVAEGLGLWAEVSYKLSRLGRIALLTGDGERSERLHRRARRLAVRESHRRLEQFADVGLALGARRRGDLDAAESSLRRWIPWVREVGGTPGLALLLAELGFIAELRGDAAEALRLHGEGLDAARATGNPRAVALALEGTAGALALAGRYKEAAGSLKAAAGARASAGAPLPPAERADVDRIEARLRAG
ncbi:AfsR/SARP family transcriptional regulator [Spirillospora sp. NBC_01491]|uniref:AfsR/SARP family transcriptional regulator n=1 Tax=Spirillospora sp. NBC_01491 TaxID=2976007 RepID=UPI002E30972E|nr:BTAD domain-containing putative transcriptional regulator [Spirillospora sp. NBC_01491]